ncbi:response regulator [Dyella sp.]|jgi:CheY-like chemotaxis protein|uniref:response regulator n=1 Tax=Dyella sp. TaxID=1869338 RepID=UPI002D78CBC0|nr:response regulator [Dyella sp.]HET6433117.1 response regulator [Dyella sp.]
MTAILLVEDEPAVREVTATLLRHCGFVMHTAATPDEALAVVARHPIDILLTDVYLLGHSDGYSMTRQLRSQGWKGRVIFTSGDPDAIDAARLEDEDAPFLPKPYGRNMLLEAIRELERS